MSSRPISVKLKAEDADSIVAALRKTGDAGQAMADQLEKSFTPTARAVENLRRNLDPLYETQQRIASSTALLDRAFKAGTVSAQQHSEMITLLNARYAPAVAGTRNLGTAVQQAGFQIGDFAVQVASGQSAMRAFIQQGTQMLGVFGPVGAAAGALLAVVGAVATSFIDLGKNTDEAAKAQDLFREAVEKTNAVLDTSAEATKRAAEEKKQLAIATNTAAAAAATEQAILLQRQLTQAQQDAATLQAGGPGLTPELTPILARSAQQVAQLTVQLDSAQAAADAALEAVDKLLNNPSGADRDEAAKTDKAIAKKAAETRAVDDYIQKLRDQLAAQKQEENQRAEITAVIEGQAKAQEDYNKGLRDTPLLRQEEVDAIKQAVSENEKLKDSEKARQDAIKQAQHDSEQRAKDAQRAFERTVQEGTDRAADILYDAFTGKIGSIGEFLKTTLARAASQGIADAFIRPLFIQPAVQAFGGFASSLGIGGFGSGVTSASAPGGSGFNLGGAGNLLSFGNGLSGGGLTGLIDSFGTSLGFASTALGPSSLAALSSTAVGPGGLLVGGGVTSQAATAGSLFGGTSLSGFLGGAGLGFGAGTLLNSLVGGHQTGGMIGAGGGALAGAAIGSIIPGIGTILGGLIGGAGGGLLGGLFGPHPSVGNVIAGQAGLGGAGNFAVDNGGDFGAARQFVTGIQAALQQIAQAAGGNITGRVGFEQSQRNGLMIYGGGTYGSDQVGFLRGLINRTISGLSPAAGSALAHSTATDASGLVSDIQFARQIERLNLSPVEQQVAALNDQYNAQIDRARQLGLETSKLVEARDKEIKAVRDQQNAQAQSTALGAVQNLRAFTQSLKFGDLTALSPDQQIEAARRDFFAVAGAAQAGDFDSISALPGYAQTYLQAERARSGSGIGYANAFDQVTGIIQGIAGLGSDALTSSAFAAQSKQTQDVFKDGLGRLVNEIVGLRADLKQVSMKPARAA